MEDCAKCNRSYCLGLCSELCAVTNCTRKRLKKKTCTFCKTAILTCKIHAKTCNHSVYCNQYMCNDHNYCRSHLSICESCLTEGILISCERYRCSTKCCQKCFPRYFPHPGLHTCSKHFKRCQDCKRNTMINCCDYKKCNNFVCIRNSCCKFKNLEKIFPVLRCNATAPPIADAASRQFAATGASCSRRRNTRASIEEARRRGLGHQSCFAKRRRSLEKQPESPPRPRGINIATDIPAARRSGCRRT